jgi:hypothetical protein
MAPALSKGVGLHWDPLVSDAHALFSPKECAVALRNVDAKAESLLSL